jgi:hypothetical protein
MNPVPNINSGPVKVWINEVDDEKDISPSILT